MQTTPQIVRIPLKQGLSEQAISATLYGAGPKAVIFSNMDTNSQQEWQPTLKVLLAAEYMLLSYDYLQFGADQAPLLKAAIDFVRSQGAKQIVLIGASRGGVTSLKLAADPAIGDSLAGVVAISAPIEHGGITFYSDEELSGISSPKLLINSTGDDGADDSRRMYNLVSEPKQLQLFSGAGHGTELFLQHRTELVKLLDDFCRSAFTD